METGLFHVNEHFNLTILEEYIEEYPEDAEKWLEFLQKKDEKILETGIQNTRQPSNTMVTPDIGEDLECNLPADFENVCIKCKRTWASTPEHLTTTLLCGHKYHTACWFLHSYEDTDHCIFEGCGQSTYGYIRELCRRRERMRVDTVSVLTDAVCSRREFKFDIKKMKRQISNCTKAFRLVNKKQQSEKNELMKKHIFTIRQIQTDMNTAVKNLSTSQEATNCTKEVKAYRRIERDIFRKYHLSLRDLMRKKIVKRMDWRVRSVLERHRRILPYNYKFGIRVYPGSKKWTVPDSEDEFDSDSEDNMADDLPATE
jgi:hypothetical protein